MSKTRRAVSVSMIAIAMSVFPLATPAQATHNCGFEPCPHPEDVPVVIEYLCTTFPVLGKYLPQICPS